MESDDMPLESFELGESSIVPSELASRAWVYLKKLHNRKEQNFQKERASLLEGFVRLSENAEHFAVELGLLSHEVARAVERQKKRDGDTEELSYLRTKLESTLKKLGVAIEDPTGEPIQGDLLSRCEVVRNTPRPDVTGHIVGEILTPTISYQGKVVHLAEVIGWIEEQQPIAPEVGAEDNG